MLKPLLLFFSSVFVAGSDQIRAQYPTANLFTNPDFESGVAGWVFGRGTGGTTPYGAANAAPISVGAAMNGAGHHLSISGWSADGSSSIANVFQGINVSSYASDIDQGLLSVRLSSWQGNGAGSSVYSRLQVQFRDASLNVLTLPGPPTVTDYRTWINRNRENTMGFREARWRVPPGTRSIRAELFFSRAGQPSTLAFADNASVALELTAVTGPAVPLDTNLLDNPGFELPGIVNPGATLEGRPVEGWYVSDTATQPETIALFGAPSAPTPAVATAIGGENQFYRPAGVPGQTSGLSQWVDLSGNASLIQAGSAYVELEGYLGAVGTTLTQARLIVEFFFPLGGAIPGGVFEVLGPNQNERNGEGIVVYRRGIFPVPVESGSMRVSISYPGSGTTFPAIDNVSAKLLDDPPPVPAPLGQNLLADANFETGPNQVVTPHGWVPNSSTFEVVNYGATSIPFATNFAAGGQQYLLSTTASSTVLMKQTFDVREHVLLVDEGGIGINLSGWFGGVGNDPDDGSLRVVYRNEFGGPVGSLTNGAVDYDETEQVLPADRNDLDDLVYRESAFTIPPGTREVDVQVRLNDRSNVNNGIADVVSAVLFLTGEGVELPGTDDGLELLTGVNSVPSSGPLEDIKTVVANDVLTVSVQSPDGRFNYQALFLALEWTPTGGTPAGLAGFPGVHLDLFGPNTLLILNPLIPNPFPAIVVPGGNSFTVVVPPGLSGLSLFWQAIAISPTAANGFYASSDAHEVVVQ